MASILFKQEAAKQSWLFLLYWSLSLEDHASTTLGIVKGHYVRKVWRKYKLCCEYLSHGLVRCLGRAAFKPPAIPTRMDVLVKC